MGLKTNGKCLVAALSLAWLLAGCDTPLTGPTQQSSPPPVPAGTFTLSGRVFLIGPAGRTPAASQPVWAVVGPRAGGTGGAYTYANTTTDADGRYAITQLPAGFAVVHAHGDYTAGYRQVCGAALQLGLDPPERDVEITSRANPQPSPTMPQLIVSGQIYETTSAGRVAVDAATIYLEWQYDSALVEVLSGADGRYSVCGIPRNWLIAFGVSKPGYIDPIAGHQFSGDSTLDIELKRR